ncbi:MAG TPA: NIPSNAP family protein [Bryobacteraceae bacterium]|nr:NIPSNAP family protein [Bryobacteraceae bacterium]
MKRRQFVSGVAAAGLANAMAAEPANPAIFELHYFYMQSGSQVDRTTQYLSNVLLPAAQRLGMGPMGFFSPVVGERSPYILCLETYSSLAQMETLPKKFADDKEFLKGWDAYNNIQDPPYVRMESTLLRAFESMPSIETRSADARRAARIFEMRTYESVNEKASMRKVQMFGNGEIGIFRRLGMTPVFFAQTVVGRNLPSLTYMLAFDDLAARERLWREFGADPEWQKLRAQPGLSDAEIVSNITNTILRPLPFSQVR